MFFYGGHRWQFDVQLFWECFSHTRHAECVPTCAHVELTQVRVRQGYKWLNHKNFLWLLRIACLHIKRLLTAHEKLLHHQIAITTQHFKCCFSFTLQMYLFCERSSAFVRTKYARTQSTYWKQKTPFLGLPQLSSLSPKTMRQFSQQLCCECLAIYWAGRWKIQPHP